MNAWLIKHFLPLLCDKAWRLSVCDSVRACVRECARVCMSVCMRVQLSVTVHQQWLCWVQRTYLNAPTMTCWWTGGDTWPTEALTTMTTACRHAGIGWCTTVKTLSSRLLGHQPVDVDLAPRSGTEVSDTILDRRDWSLWYRGQFTVH